MFVERAETEVEVRSADAGVYEGFTLARFPSDVDAVRPCLGSGAGSPITYESCPMKSPKKATLCRAVFEYRLFAPLELLL